MAPSHAGHITARKPGLSRLDGPGLISVALDQDVVDKIGVCEPLHQFELNIKSIIQTYTRLPYDGALKDSIPDRAARQTRERTLDQDRDHRG